MRRPQPMSLDEVEKLPQSFSAAMGRKPRLFPLMPKLKMVKAKPHRIEEVNLIMEPQVYITSLNQKLFEDYGKNFIESWLANSAPDLVLIVVHEEEKANYLAPYNSRNVISLPLVSEEYVLFQKEIWEIYRGGWAIFNSR